MSPSSQRVFIFYRDLRLDDNLGLMELAKRPSSSSKKPFVMIPVFLLDRSEWKSKNQYQFMVECLVDLDKILRKKGSRLHIFTKTSFRQYLRTHRDDIDMIGWNLQYEHPARYDFIRKSLLHTTEIVEMDDMFMTDPSTLHHKPFKKFTPFYRYCLSHFRIQRPKPFTSKRLGKIQYPNLLNPATMYKDIRNKNAHFYTQGGYRNAVRQLMFAKKHLRHYGETRNTFSIPTSKLSAYLSLNVLSIRHVYYVMNPVSKDFVRELYWRDFYLYVAKYFPKVLAYGAHPPSLLTTKQKAWKQWKNGTTGKPIVDACMRQLNTTGYMHNRGRMIVASYLIKNLHIHFKYGERYFEEKLIDHNRPSNNGGWQWVNGSGVDSQPSYQKFSMLLQNKKYDPECIFVKEWLPHLRALPPSEIFALYS